jgi:hypothetical protein
VKESIKEKSLYLWNMASEVIIEAAIHLQIKLLNRSDKYRNKLIKGQNILT